MTAITKRNQGLALVFNYKMKRRKEWIEKLNIPRDRVRKK
jgi:hypothetical protein